VIVIDLSKSGSEDAWFVVQLGQDRPKARVNVIRTDEGLVIDVWPDDDDSPESVASTYVFDAELDNVEE